MEDKKTKWQQVLDLFCRRQTWSNYELLSLTPRLVNPPKQIFELRKRGYNIVTEEDKSDRKKIYYTLIPKNDLFGHAA